MIKSKNIMQRQMKLKRLYILLILIFVSNLYAQEKSEESDKIESSDIQSKENKKLPHSDFNETVLINEEVFYNEETKPKDIEYLEKFDDGDELMIDYANMGNNEG